MNNLPDGSGAVRRAYGGGIAGCVSTVPGAAAPALAAPLRARLVGVAGPAMRYLEMAAAVLLLGGLAVMSVQPSRADAPAHPAAASRADARALYLKHCGICHLKGGTGTFMLSRRLGKQRALLAQRTDLTAAYVKAVVRNGLNSMPAFTRVEVTDRELDAIAAYLARHHASGGGQDARP